MGISFEAAGRFQSPRLVRGIGQRFPDLHRPLRWNQQPAKPGAMALVGSHFLAQGGEAAGAFVAGTGTTGARELHHQIGAEGSETAALLGAEGLPAIEGHQRGIGAEHGVVGEAEAGGAVEQLQEQRAVLKGLPEKATEGAVAGAHLASGGGHADQGTSGGQLQHRLAMAFFWARCTAMALISSHLNQILPLDQREEAAGYS